VPDKRGGLNGSMQHLPKVLSYGSRRLISFAGFNANKTKALFRFWLSPVAQINSRLEVLSNQPVIWCCIDRLSSPGLSECGFLPRSLPGSVCTSHRGT
jgi:hypothetical protein